MSNENGKPWWKNPKIVIPAIIGVVTIIVFFPSPDFNIYVNPIQGSVHQGGEIATTITVKRAWI